MVKKPYLNRATTRELLEEVRQRILKDFEAGNNAGWNRIAYRDVVDLQGKLPKEILDIKGEEN